MALTPDALVNKSLELVSSPSIYGQLNELIQDPNSSADDISEIINTDPALTTRLLKVVNSPYYGFPSQITNISRAVTIIGTSELIQLVLATSVINAFQGIPADLIKMDEFWTHSLACALTAKIVAKKCKLPASEHFFTAGLLHNIGALVLYQTMPELAREAINSARFGHETLQHAEARLLGFDHCSVGEALIKSWRLPAALMEVTRYHHSPALAEEFKTEVAVVHIADIITTSTGLYGHAGDTHVPPLSEEAWDHLGLDVQELDDIVLQLADQINDLTSALI
jgi:HD-like signal output (HDOD) protein